MSNAFDTGRGALSFLGICFGLMILFFGLMMHILVGPLVDFLFQWIFLAVIFIGLVLVAMGFALYPGSRRRAKLWKTVLEIAAVEKEVTISDLHTRTGIDAEIVRKILVHCLMNGMLFGYIEGDLFVRNTSAGPSRFYRRTGLYGG